MTKRRATRKGSGSATVSIHVRDAARLFNSLDPSPFWDRDLDRDAAAFIEEEFSDKPAADAWHLNVHVHDGGALGSDLQAAIENYYDRLASSVRRQLREHLLMGQLGLLAGIAIFLLSMGARELLRGSVHELPRILDEGLIILAWLALWRPTEVLAYEWVPLYRKRRLYRRLAGIRVAIRPEPASEPGAADHVSVVTG